MKRNIINICVDLVSFLVMLGLIWTGFLIHYVLPLGTGGRHSEPLLTLWGLGRHDYGNIHFYLALILIGLMVIHVWLHWSWICTIVNKLVGKESTGSNHRTTYGIVLFAIIVVFISMTQFWAKSQIKSTTSVIKTDAIGGKDQIYSNISGQITLAQAAEIGEIPVERLILKLQLPADVDVDERLGRLKRQYSFEIEDVRRILQQSK